MKKIIYALLATLTGLVLLFSYRTSLGESMMTSAAGATTTGTSGSSSSSTSGGESSDSSESSSSDSSGSSSSGSSSSGSSSTGSSGSSSSGLKDGSFTGQAVDTPYGPVQVQITVSGGSITKVNIPVYPNGNGRDQEINSFALPQLVSETKSAQSAGIDMVSGATFTSQGYIQSLQSAIDQAHA